MTSPVITVTRDTPVREAVKLMIEKNIGCVAVVDAEGRLEGLMTERRFMPEQVAVPFMHGTLLLLLGEWVDSSSFEEAIEGFRGQRVDDVMARGRADGDRGCASGRSGGHHGAQRGAPRSDSPGRRGGGYRVAARHAARLYRAIGAGQSRTARAGRLRASGLDERPDLRRVFHAVRLNAGGDVDAPGP